MVFCAAWRLLLLRFSEPGSVNVLKKESARKTGAFLVKIEIFYLATRSSHFTMLSMTIMDSAVAAANTSQQAHRGTLV